MTPNTILHQFDNARLGRFHLALMLLAGACWTLAGYGVTIIGFLLPSLRAEWQVSSGALGLAAAMGMAGMLIGAILAGSLADRFGRRAVLTWTLLYLGVLFLATSQAWSYAALLVLRLLTGVGLGAVLPVSSTLITEFSPAKYRGAMAVLLNAFWGLGGTLTALAGYTLVLKYGWRPAMLLGGASLLLSPLVRFGLPESLRFLLGKGRLDEAQRELARLRLAPTDPKGFQPEDPKEDPEGFPKDPKGLWRPLGSTSTGGIWSAAYARITLALWVLWVALNFFYQGAYIWLPTLLASTQLSEGRSFLLTLLISLGQIPGTLTAAWLADRVSRRKLILASMALLAVAAFLFGLSQADAWVLAVGFLLMFFNGMAWGINYPFSSELYPTRMRASATGWASGIGRIGGVLAPIVVGLVVQAGGSLLTVFALLAAAPFAATLVVSGIKLETTGRSLEEISEQ